MRCKPVGFNCPSSARAHSVAYRFSDGGHQAVMQTGRQAGYVGGPEFSSLSLSLFLFLLRRLSHIIDHYAARSSSIHCCVNSERLQHRNRALTTHCPSTTVAVIPTHSPTTHSEGPVTGFPTLKYIRA